MGRLSTTQFGQARADRNMTTNSFRVQVTGEPGRKLEVQSTGDFTMWEPIATVTLGDQPFELEDSTATNRSQRFYRAVQRE